MKIKTILCELLYSHLTKITYNDAEACFLSQLDSINVRWRWVFKLYRICPPVSVEMLNC
jgi:hypothetical protein